MQQDSIDPSSAEPAPAALDDGRGRDADSPARMPARAWRDILWRTWSETTSDNVGLIAAGVAFYSFLAFVPLLAAVVLSYGLFADPATVVGHLHLLFDLLPTDAALLIGEQLVSITQMASEKAGLGLVAALALAVYGGMNGAGAIITALNIAYDEEETRSLVKTTALAMVITLALVAVGIAAILAIAALTFLEELLPGAPAFVLTGLRVVFWLFAAIVANLIVSAIYRYAPDRRRARWVWLTPGSLLATTGWLAMTFGFGLYVANFANYNATYGALSAVVVLMMWLFLSAYILVTGAEFNAEIEHQTARDTTVGIAKPLGRRGAYVADTIGETP